MNVTFLIGNGFDLNIGINTRYTDFYKYYLDKETKDERIISFKNILKSKLEDEETWADFETAMAKNVDCFNSEDDFVHCIRDFKSHLRIYLKEQEKIFVDFTKEYKYYYYCDNFLTDIMNCYNGLVPNDVNYLNELFNTTNNRFDFIVFNYTNIFSTMLSNSLNYISTGNQFMDRNQFEKPIFVHGELNDGLVLGTDSEEQLICSKFKLTDRGKMAFVKPFINDLYDRKRVSNCIEKINKSDIVCSFGFSFGESDKMWVNTIVEWLKENENHHLICFGKPNDFVNDNLNLDEIIEEEYFLKNELLDVLGLLNNIEMYKQVHIPLRKRIFEIDFTNTVGTNTRMY